FCGCFGLAAHILPFFLIVFGILILARGTVHVCLRTVILCAIVFLMIAMINSGRYIDEKGFEYAFGFGAMKEYAASGVKLESGGLFGMYFGSIITRFTDVMALYLICGAVIFICLLFVINTPVSRFVERHSESRRAKKEAAAEERLERDLELALETGAGGNAGADKKSRREENRAQKRREKADLYATSQLDPEDIERARDERPDNAFTAGADDGSRYGGEPDGEGLSDNKKNILDYMNNDEPFVGNGQSSSTGSDIEEPKEALPKEAAAAAAGAAAAAAAGKKADKQTLDEKEFNAPKTRRGYKFPPIDLLKKGDITGMKTSRSELRERADKLEETLRNFRVDARVVDVVEGPAVTRYEIQPEVGVKVSSIKNLADDIALNMEAKSIRIEAPIPGKKAVGIEIENESSSTVTLRDIIASKEFKDAKSKISFALGRDISGKSIVPDLKQMPHMLIAGATGSGKSVCVNSIILSMLYKARPEELKFILVDPKVVELTNYNGIPHLLIPVVTEPAKAAAALNWACAEMDDRYKKFASEGVRELAAYNKAVKARGENDLFLPQIVIIIDELADLMMEAPSQVEESICRLAQKARAAGMHLIVATQRPSVDVVTGLIKANIPSRIALTVASQVDSRTILDMSGAEKLVGKGDMLFSPVSASKPRRVQGTFVSDEEVNDVIEFVKSQVDEHQYAEDVIDTIENTGKPGVVQEDEDELLPDAIETVVHAGQASVSMLQRRFRIGYNRAARIMEMLEERGIVGPPDGARPRQVLMTEDEYYAAGDEAEEETPDAPEEQEEEVREYEYVPFEEDGGREEDL
ncbi:MAG: DNA translocase FtsK, partial [Firmicutes bacterium]|nr:DNA translocase FtsK [Bacillota bacterium]